MGLTSNPWPWPLKVYVERSAFALKRRCDYACDEQSFAHSFQFADCTAHARRPQREPSLPRQESYHGRKSLIPLSHLCGSSRGSLRFWKYWWSAEGCGCLAEGRGRLTFSLWSIRFLHGLRAVRGIFAVFSITVEHRGLNRTVWKGYWPMKAFLTVRWSNKQHWSNGRCYSCYERHQRSQFIQDGIELSFLPVTSIAYTVYTPVIFVRAYPSQPELSAAYHDPRATFPKHANGNLMINYKNVPCQCIKIGRTACMYSSWLFGSSLLVICCKYWSHTVWPQKSRPLLKFH